MAVVPFVNHPHTSLDTVPFPPYVEEPSYIEPPPRPLNIPYGYPSIEEAYYLGFPDPQEYFTLSYIAPLECRPLFPVKPETWAYLEVTYPRIYWGLRHLCERGNQVARSMLPAPQPLRYEPWGPGGTGYFYPPPPRPLTPLRPPPSFGYTLPSPPIFSSPYTPPHPRPRLSPTAAPFHPYYHGRYLENMQ